MFCPTDNELPGVKMNIAPAIRAVKDQIIKLQWGKTYPLDETLENLELERAGGIVFDQDTKRWKISMILRSAAGESAQFGVGVPGLGNTDIARATIVGV